MRSIFFRLLVSFSLTILLAGLISGLIMFSFSRRSVDSFRRDFQQQMQNNIARAMALMGQAAFVMRQHRGDQAFVDYVQEIQDATRTRLYLETLERVLPSVNKFIIDPTVRTDGTELWLTNPEATK